MCKTNIICGLVFLLIAGASIADPHNYSPTIGKNYPNRVYWGDTHLHSNNSMDAYLLGNTRLTAEDAYRFARGEEIKSQNGLPVKIREPLDFLVVADHAEFMGVFPLLDVEDSDFMRTKLGQRWSKDIKAGQRKNIIEDFVNAVLGKDQSNKIDISTKRSIWSRAVERADKYNDPGSFTTFSGYEWTSMPNGNNLHRVVIFKDGAEKVQQVVPWSAMDSDDPEQLWQYLDDYAKHTGGEALIIPHNPNLSNGLMFATETLSGSPISETYARTRARWEPLLEVTQVKGDSEAHPFLSPDDGFADYETWDQSNINKSAVKENKMLKHEYARSALQIGLQMERKLGVNPFKFGLIGSTDFHTSLATGGEDNFFGKFSKDGPRPGRAANSMTYDPDFFENWRIAAAGYAAVWARENTRESIFRAMQRKETYATTGPRILLRFFGGWDFEEDDIYRPDYVDVGYKGGVPMGGDITNAPVDKSPRFMVLASKDPHAANLDRIQIVKGWLDKDNRRHEKVHDIAWSDGRVVNLVTGKLSAVGNTVNVKEASYRNTIGAVQLAKVWIDPDFDPTQAAFYYVRVLEIPTPRWTAYDAKHFNIEMPDEAPMLHQERAYSSPIWYTP